MELDDCGKEVWLQSHLFNQDYPNWKYGTNIRVTPKMVITHPRGTLAIFGDDLDRQCEAIKRFMEFCNHQDSKIPNIVCGCGRTTMVTGASPGDIVMCMCGKLYTLGKWGKHG